MTAKKKTSEDIPVQENQITQEQFQAMNPVEQAKLILKQEEDIRIQSFVKEYEELIKKYNVQIQPVTQLLVVPKKSE